MCRFSITTLPSIHHDNTIFRAIALICIALTDKQSKCLEALLLFWNCIVLYCIENGDKRMHRDEVCKREIDGVKGKGNGSKFLENRLRPTLY